MANLQGVWLKHGVFIGAQAGCVAGACALKPRNFCWRAVCPVSIFE